MGNETAISRLKPAYVASAVLILLMLILTWYGWTHVPAGHRIPLQWGVDGQPDRYSGRFEGLLLTPLIAVATAIFLAVMPLFEPRRLNLERSWKAYSAVWLAVMLLLAVVHAALVLGALGRNVDMNLIVPMLLGGLFIVFGNYMGKLRSNFFMGIRSPWTLSSELSWNKTHRLGGWLFVGYGIGLIVLAVVASTQVLLVIALVGVGAVVLTIGVYSYLVWRQDPAKQKVGR